MEIELPPGQFNEKLEPETEELDHDDAESVQEVVKSELDREMEELEKLILNDPFDSRNEREVKEEWKNLENKYASDEKFDPDKDLLELEYLIANPGATLVGEDVKHPENSKILQKDSTRDTSAVVRQQDFPLCVIGIPSIESQGLEGNSLFVKPFKEELKELPIQSKDVDLQGMFRDPFHLFLIPNQERKELLQEIHGGKSGRYWYDIGGLLGTIRDYFEKFEKECNCNWYTVIDGWLFRKTREWFEAWVNRNWKLCVSNELLFVEDILLICKCLKRLGVIGNGLDAIGV